MRTISCAAAGRDGPASSSLSSPRPSSAGTADYRLFWRWRSRILGGRPKVTDEIRGLIRLLADDATITPTRILSGHLHQQLFDIRLDSRPAPTRREACRVRRLCLSETASRSESNTYPDTSMNVRDKTLRICDFQTNGVFADHGLSDMSITSSLGAYRNLA